MRTADLQRCTEAGDRALTASLRALGHREVEAPSVLPESSLCLCTEDTRGRDQVGDCRHLDQRSEMFENGMEGQKEPSLCFVIAPAHTLGFQTGECLSAGLCLSNPAP